MLASPQRVQVHSLRVPAPMPQSHSPRLDYEAQAALDAELDRKKMEVAESEKSLHLVVPVAWSVRC